MANSITKINLEDECLLDVVEKRPQFDVYLYKNLLDQEIVDQLRKDISTKINVEPKNNDLYKFKQSKDLKCQVPEGHLTPLIKSFTTMMLHQVREHLAKTSGLELSKNSFDITVSRYDKGDYLLCHNDDIEDPSRETSRAIAFVYYLNTRTWTRDDGGALMLYDSDEKGEPINISSRICPSQNSLVLFKTSSQSWHSVEEVYCDDDTRLSINGWFHHAESKEAPVSTKKINEIEQSLFDFVRPATVDERVEKFFKECINNEYLMGKTRYLIRRKFKRNSEINLNDFLVKEKYQEISEALKKVADNEDNLQPVGPYNKRHYMRIKLDSLPQICRDLYDAFRSELFFMLLSRLTGLELQPPNIIHEIKETENSSDDEDSSDSEDSSESEDSSDSEDSGDCSYDDEGEELATDDSCDLSVKDSELQEETSSTSESEDNGETEKKAKPSEKSEQQEDKSDSGKDPSEPDEATPSKRKRLNDPIARLEFRHLDHGSYTLIHDYGYEQGEKFALDVVLHFNHDFTVNLENGGYICYLDGSPEVDSKDCELLTIEPKSNCLSLVYRSDNSTCRFFKYITKSHESSFQDLYCVYYEKPDDLPHPLSKEEKE